jgi:glycogen synthase
MKVLMTADSVGGVWVYALELADALAAHGVEVVLATMGAPLRPDQRAAATALGNVTLEEGGWRLEWMEEPWADVARGTDWLHELEARHSPDVVHLNDLTRGDEKWRAPSLVVGHSCVLSWWTAVRRDAPPAGFDEYRRRVSRSLRAAPLVLAPTAAILAELARWYEPFVRSGVIHNGRSADRFRPGAKQPFVLGAGRVWDEGKNLGALGRVAGELPWPVLLAGDARHPDGGVAECGPARLLGPLDEPALAQRYAAAAICALPARYEPFGLSALEAALAGCALVLGDIPTLLEVWGDAALFVDPFDDAALASALRRLCEDGRRRDELAGRSRARAARYSAEAMAAGYVEAYRSLAGPTDAEPLEVTACAS